MPVRMRFPAEALAEMKRDDPGTPVTLHLIRSLLADGKIPYVLIGRRRLLNYDALLEYLANPPQIEETTGRIRAVSERASQMNRLRIAQQNTAPDGGAVEREIIR